MAIRRIHYISGITLSVFIFFHLLNHLFALCGPDAHIAVMEKFRKIYRHPVVETLLFAAVIFQVVTGVRLLILHKACTLAEKLQIWSGLYLSLFLVIHVGAVVAGRYIFNLDTNFYFAAAGMNYFPATLLFLPYYSLSVVAIFFHISAIHFLKTGAKKTARTIAVTGIIASILILLGFTDFFHWVLLPGNYHDFIEKLFLRGG